MDEVSAAGAEAVAVYFLQLFPYVFATNELSEWRELSHPECIFCASVIGNVEEHMAEGVHSVGALVTITESAATEVEPGRWWSIDAEVVQDPSQDLDSNGGVVEDFPERKSYHMDLAVIFENGQWVVREVSFERTDS